MEEKRESSDSRANGHPFFEKATDRVEYVIGLMTDRVWNPDTSRSLQKALSEAWGVTQSTIRNYSAEASHSMLGTVRERRAELAKQAVETLLEVAKSEVQMPGDRAAKVSASKVLLEFAGVDRPDEDKVQKHIVAGMGEATPDKAREVVRALFGDIVPQSSPAELEDSGKR